MAYNPNDMNALKMTHAQQDTALRVRRDGCAQRGCTNWREEGYIFCTYHLHGAPVPMSSAEAAIKLALDEAGVVTHPDYEE